MLFDGNSARERCEARLVWTAPVLAPMHIFAFPSFSWGSSVHLCGKGARSVASMFLSDRIKLCCASPEISLTRALCAPDPAFVLL